MDQGSASDSSGGMLSIAEQTMQGESSAPLSKSVQRAAALLLELSGYVILMKGTDSELPRQSLRLSSVVLGELVEEVLAIAALLQAIPDHLQMFL